VAIARDVVEDFRPRAEAKKLAVILEAHDAHPITTDPRLLRVMLANLVDNAVKFTEAGEVRVDVAPATGAEGNHGALAVRVRDTGRGIPERSRGSVFEAFEQLDPVGGRHTPGIGLGLAIVRHVAAALGARIDLASRVGEGTTVGLVFPREPP
jgi:signal transduction histidine kinase